MNYESSFRNYKETIDFIMKVFESCDYVFVLPATGEFKTKLDLMTIRNKQTIENIFLGSDERFLDKYNIKQEDDLVRRLEKFNKYVLDLWNSFNETIVQNEQSVSFSRRVVTTYDEDHLAVFERLLEGVTAIVVFFVRKYHQLLISDLSSITEEKQNLLRSIGSILIKLLEVRIAYNDFEIYLIMSENPSKRMTSLPGPMVRPTEMASILLTNVIFDRSLIAITNSNADYEYIFSSRFSLFLNLTSFATIYYWTKGGDILVNIYADLLEKENTELVEHYIKLTGIWFVKKKGLIEPTSFVLKIMEKIIMFEEAIEKEVTSVFLEQCLMTMNYVATMIKHCNFEDTKTLAMENFEYIVEEILFLNAKEIFKNLSDAAKYYPPIFSILAGEFRDNPEELERKIIDTQKLIDNENQKKQFVNFACEGIKKYMVEANDSSLKDIVANLSNLS